MKKYKTWEMIKMLEENPNLKFKPVDQSYEVKTLKGDSGNIELVQGNYNSSVFLYLNYEWTLIQTPVPFLEAVQAYSEGKTIRCEYSDTKTIFSPEFNTSCIGFGMWFATKYEATVSTGQILEGKWYVE